MISTFSGFYMAKGGMDAARANLNVTGQNMLNAKTPGYTRQRVDLYAAGTSGHNTLYAEPGPIIGRGVEIGGISQIRDPYLDLRYRREHSKIGDTSVQLDALNDLEGFIDEIATKGMTDQLEDFLKQLQNVSNNLGDPVAEGIAKNSALTLVKLFNNISTQLAGVRKEQLTYTEGAVTKVNDLLSGISKLNGDIRKANVVGDPALELLDTRNSMLDELAGYMNIEINTKQVDIGSGFKVDELEINMIGKDGQVFNLIDNTKHGSIGLAKDAKGNITFPVDIQLFNKDGMKVNGSVTGGVGLTDGKITDQLNTGALSGFLKTLNKSGEYDNPPSSTRGIGYYEKRLDTLASTFADSFNKVNSMNAAPPWDKPLFESKDGAPITASNIQIAQKWTNSKDLYLTATKNTDPDSKIKNDNLIVMIALFKESTEFTSPITTGAGGQPIFKGTFQAYFADVSTTLGIESKAMQRENDTYNSVMVEIEKQRSSVSGVSVDEEGINMIQYNHALTAASRYMTTLDEGMDTIINRMGIVGR